MLGGVSRFPRQFAIYWFFGAVPHPRKSWVQTRVEPYVSGRAPFGPQLGATGWSSGFFWPIETAFALLNFRTFCTFEVRPPAVAICDLLDFWGSRDKFHRHPGPEMGQRRRKSGFSRSWGPFWAKRPPTKFDRMLNADPVNLVWGPMCPWGPRYGPFFFGGGAKILNTLFLLRFQRAHFRRKQSDFGPCCPL